MKSRDKEASKELYRELRRLSCNELWKQVENFDRLTSTERNESVGLIRALGVVISMSGDAEQKAKARRWLRQLLNDPNEKVRRYAMTALPKLDAGPDEEAALLALRRSTVIEREKKFLEQTLQTIGGPASLKEIESGQLSIPVQAEQRIKASVLRETNPSSIRLEAILSDYRGLRVHLHGRQGLEKIIAEEAAAKLGSKFRVLSIHTRCVALSPQAAFSVGDLYKLRCFSHLGFVLGNVKIALGSALVEPLASIMTSTVARRLFQTFTEGSIRYRLEILTKENQEKLVQELAGKVYVLSPEILNDPRSSPWSVVIRRDTDEFWVELVPRLTEPRFFYRQQDVPAASYPPLAASMARLAGRAENEVVWDPFCGSGLELIERGLLGGVRKLVGSDISPEAISIATKNFAAANLKNLTAKFSCGDFRDCDKIEGLEARTTSLIITNPPMGKRVPVPDLPGLINDLFTVSINVLRPGGRLVFCNPLFIESRDSRLKLQSRRTVDFGGFNCRLEVYRKAG